MAESFDDEIIDLTDLMEEGDAAKKSAAPAPKVVEKTKLLEPETFDLGKEISLDDDITIDTSAPLDELDLAPQSPAEPAQEPAAFSGDEPPREPLESLDDFDSLITEPAPKQTPQADLSVPDDFTMVEPQPKEDLASGTKVRSQASVSPVFDAFFQETVEEVKIESSLGLSEPVKPQKPVEPVEAPVVVERGEAEVPAPSIETVEPFGEEPAAPVAVQTPVEDVAAAPLATQAAPEPPLTPPTPVPPEEPKIDRQAVQAQVQATAEKVRQEVPALLEEIVRPVMDDLIREITQTTRDILPGIVEKIIREEIEKLKKLD